MSRSILAFIVIGLLVTPLRARGTSSSEEEETLIHRGIELRKARDDLSACAQFQKAYDLTHSPRAAAQLGLAEFALGRWDDAEVHVRQGLQTPGDPFIKKYRVQLDESLATIKTHVARVEVIGEPPGAEVLVNGRLAGQLPLATPIAVSEGQVDVELRARGFARASRTVTVSGGQYQRLVMRLQREGSAADRAPPSPTGTAAPGHPSTPSAPVVPSVASTVDPGGSVATEADAEATAAGQPANDEGGGPSTARRVAKWTALGLAGAGLAVGIGASAIHSNNSSTFERLHGGGCFDNAGRAVDAAGNAVTECQPSLDASRSSRVWQIVGFAGAGVFAVAWLVLALTEPPSTDGAAPSQPAVAWTCAPAPTLATASAACAVRF